MKIGRNDPCPCGSGKKYKKCCIAKPLSTTNKKMTTGQKSINAFLAGYCLTDLVQSFAGLSIIPENHGKYLRMEELAGLSIQSNMNSRLVPGAADLRGFLNAEFTSDPMEDP